MDKEAFLHQLESSLANSDKKLFTKTIYDLPTDVIAGFTKEEFSRIIYISHQFSSQKMDRLANFLENKGLFFLKNALKGIDELNNSLLSKFYYTLFISLYKTNQEKVKSALANNAVACIKLAEMGIDCKENLEASIYLCSDARVIFHKTSLSYASALMNEGSARSNLAEMGIDSRENLETAVSLYGDAREIFPKTSVDYARVLMNEGNARSELADMGFNSRENLENFIRLCGDAKEIFPKTSVDYARALMNEGSARSKLANMGFDSRENLETAISLYDDSRELFSKTSADYAGALMNEGSTRIRLAEMGIDSRENLETAVSLYGDSRKRFSKTSVDYASALMNEGTARLRLADMDVNSQENYNISKKLYLESISILEKLGDVWTYSTAILNFNSQLKDIFYKTGDKKYIEEWEENLKDIEKKIKNRDIRYKERVMARIHEIRASLLEFNGKQGISDASFEYYEAYELSKEPFYKFMKEFCQARSDNKSFCKIASDWNKYKKKGIFLDYYDYTVFECHLENALKKSIFRKDELESARQKLEEIGNRTQIKIIKDRVSAYIF